MKTIQNNKEKMIARAKALTQRLDHMQDDVARKTVKTESKNQENPKK